MNVNRDKLVSFVQDIVRIPSMSGDEKLVAERVQQEMHALGYDRIEVDEYGSVVGVIEGAHEGKTLLFDGHTDTVGVTSGTPWDRVPFSGDVDDEAIHGRGSADMKGAVGSFIYAAAAVDKADLRGRIVVSASTMEEVLEGVALQAVMERESPDCVIIGESTELNLAIGGRGRAEIHLETIGVSTHSSSPHLGRNAILDMLKVIQAAEELPMPQDEFMGSAVLGLCDIISVPYPGHSVIPSICRATYDRRLLPGETAEDVLGEITSTPAAQSVQLKATIGIGEYQTYTGATMRLEKFLPAWRMDSDHWLVRACQGGLQAAGLSPNTIAYQFCTNAAYSAGNCRHSHSGLWPGKRERCAYDQRAPAAQRPVRLRRWLCWHDQGHPQRLARRSVM